MTARAIARGFNLAAEALPAAPTFADVPASDPDFRYVEALYRAGISAGCATSPRRFCPDQLVTRGQLSVFLMRALNVALASGTAEPYFSDVPPTAYYFSHVQAMRRLGITAGCSATTFCPDASMTRGQLAVFVVRGMLLAP